MNSLVQALRRSPKPGEEANALEAQAKDGISAIMQLVAERDQAIARCREITAAFDKVRMENEVLKKQNAEAMSQRDYWMQHNARVEAQLANLWNAINQLGNELRAGAETMALASRFAPETGNAKSVG